MRWPDIERQSPGSMLCGDYATAYLERLLGRSLEGCRAEWTRDHPACAPDRAYAHSSGWDAWVRRWIERGHVALAQVHERPDFGHAVVLLEADAAGVLVADPGRGLVRIPWARFARPQPGGLWSFVSAWWRLPSAREAA